MATFDVGVNVSSWELRTLVADKLHLKVHSFDLIDSSGTTVSKAWKVADHVITIGKPVALTLAKDGVDRNTSSGYLNLQSAGSESAAADHPGANHKKNYVNPIWIVSFSLFTVFVFSASMSKWCERAVKVCLLIASNGNRKWLTADLSCQVWWMRFTLVSSMYLIESLLDIKTCTSLISSLWNMEFTWDNVPCWNSTVLALQNMVAPEFATAYVERMKCAQPVMEIRAHYSKEVMVFTQKGVSKGGVPRGEYEPQPVHSHTIADRLDIQHWCDDSGDFPSVLHRFPLVRIQFGLDCRAADLTTIQTHWAKKSAFQQAGAPHVFEEFSYLDAENADASDTNEQLPFMEVLACGYSAPFWLDWRFYVFASVMGLSWPYRWWLLYISLHGDFMFIKRVWSHKDTDITASD